VNPATDTAPAHARSLSRWARKLKRRARRAGAGGIHKLRVALRTLRVIAGGISALDPEPRWLELRRKSGRLLRRLSRARDARVTLELARTLAGTPDHADFLPWLEKRARKAERRALRGWNRDAVLEVAALAASLADRACSLAGDDLAFEHLALEALELVLKRHRACAKAPGREAYHELRLALKRFRYLVENFLPALALEWESAMREAQDTLGAMHDLDVLDAALDEPGCPVRRGRKSSWRRRTQAAFDALLARYRHLVAGRATPYEAWSEALPRGNQLTQAAFARLRATAQFVDPRAAEARHVAHLAQQLYDGISRASLGPPFGEARAARTLRAAALLHGLARDRTGAARERRSAKLIRSLPVPLGIEADELALAALVVRYSGEEEPQAVHHRFGRLGLRDRELVSTLAGVLRVARALDAARDGAITGVQVEVSPESVALYPQGDLSNPAMEHALVRAKPMLEQGLQRIIVLRPGSPPRLLAVAREEE
jgi:CHAD domain-containing protein